MMAWAQSSSASSLSAASPNRPAQTPSWLRRAVRSLDRLLRRVQGIYEFGGEHCLLRLAAIRAPAAVRLADGTAIARGERILALHLWNEHLPLPDRRRPSFAWASRLRQEMLQSLWELAAYAQAYPESASAFCCRIAFADHRRRGKMIRIAAKLGFERLAPQDRLPGMRVHDLLENFWLLGLVFAFNPAALRRRAFFRERDELWISRKALIRRYGAREPAARDRHDAALARA
jgi:hypothetical protein